MDLSGEIVILERSSPLLHVPRQMEKTGSARCVTRRSGSWKHLMETSDLYQFVHCHVKSSVMLWYGAQVYSGFRREVGSAEGHSNFGGS